MPPFLVRFFLAIIIKCHQHSIKRVSRSLKTIHLSGGGLLEVV